jgi:hypothetical protein
MMMHAPRRIARHRALLCAALCLCFAAPARAQRDETNAAEEASLRPAPDSRVEAARRSRQESKKPVVYRPPRRGSPQGRVAGGVRGATALPQPLALAPDHVGHTLRSTPSLFWHIDGTPPETARIVFTLVLVDGVEPILERELPIPAATGIQRVRLADLGVSLDPEVDYAWSVSLLAGDDRAADLVSEGALRRVGADALEGRPPSARAFAEQGLWYDALEALSDALEAVPGDAELGAQRDSLLRQAGLGAALAQVRP